MLDSLQKPALKPTSVKNASLNLKKRSYSQAMSPEILFGTHDLNLEENAKEYQSMWQKDRNKIEAQDVPLRRKVYEL